MKLSTSWLKNGLRRTISDRELADALELAGIEVEQLIGSTFLDPLIVVGKVKKCVQHPNADRLKLTTVEVPAGELQIVCGAPNVREGLTVAVAQVGATLPSGDTITKAKLRGEASNGMLCSARELGLGDDHDGLIELSDTLAVGTKLAELYPADGQIEIKTAANRPDLQSIEGLAREVAAQTDNEAIVETKTLPEQTDPAKLAVESDLTTFFVLAELSLSQDKKHKLETYQSWLRTSNVRSISPVVDITNIAMMETGQPLHAYDADKVQGAVVVRMARDGERLTTLDGKERTLSSDDQVVADDSGPIGLAGVMGGAATEVSTSTKRIYLEAATFDGATVRKTAQRHKLRTEGSARFERGLPVEFAAHGLMRAIGFLEQEVGAKVLSLNMIGSETAEPVEIHLEEGRLARLVKDVISLNDAAKLLPKLGYKTAVGYEDDSTERTLVLQVPYWRPDVKLQEDVIEDVVRLVGYDKIPATLPTWRPADVRFDRTRTWTRRLNELLVGAGLQEVHTYSFVSQEQIELLGGSVADFLPLANPMSQEQAYLRRSPLPNLLASLKANEEGRRQIGLYEVTGVFESTTTGELPHEPQRLAVIWADRAASYGALKGIFDAVGRLMNLDLELVVGDEPNYAPGRGATVKLGDVPVGRIGQLAPAVVRAHRLGGEVSYFELDLAPLLQAATVVTYDAAGKFPAARRDLALLVDQDVSWQAVRNELPTSDQLRVSFLNDYYGDDLPQGKKSLALRLELSAPDHTLTDAEVNDQMGRLTKLLVKAFDATVR